MMTANWDWSSVTSANFSICWTEKHLISPLFNMASSTLSTSVCSRVMVPFGQPCMYVRYIDMLVQSNVFRFLVPLFVTGGTAA